MSKKWYSFLLVLLFSGRSFAQSSGYDIVIYGGTSAGVMAAVQAARMGKSVVLLSPAKHLGGLSSSGLGWTDLGKANTIGGLSREFYQAVYKHYQQGSAWRQETRDEYIGKMLRGQVWDQEMVPANGIMTTFEPHVAEKIFNDFLRGGKVVVLTGQWLDRKKGVKMVAGTIRSITMTNGKTYRGKAFIDATYEGDLMAAAGVTYTVGREANSQYNETLNGIETAHAAKNQLPPGIDPYVKPNDATSGLLPGIHSTAGGEDGEGDDKIQAYCYRLCLTDAPGNVIKIKKPASYKELDFEMVLRAAALGYNNYFKFDKMPNRKTDSNNSGGMSMDYIGGNYRYPEADYAERKIIEQQHIYWQTGLIWTIQNHPRVPDSIRRMYKNWGLPGNEFKDNNYWPYQIYVREARRMVSDLVMTEAYCTGKVVSERPVAIGSYTMDSHNAQRYAAIDDGKKAYIRNEGDVQVEVPKPYLIDFGVMVPKKGEAKNLVVPVCLSASHIAYGSIRMEPVFMMLGQAAATAAAIAIDRGNNMQEVDYELVRERLLKDNMILTIE